MERSELDNSRTERSEVSRQAHGRIHVEQQRISHLHSRIARFQTWRDGQPHRLFKFRHIEDPTAVADEALWGARQRGTV